MRVQVPAAHEARLRRMGMDPAQDHQVRFRVNEIKQLRLIRHLTRVGGGRLCRHDELADEQSIRDERAGKESTCLKIGLGILVGQSQERGSQSWWKKYGAQGCSILQARCRCECVAW